MSVFGTTAALPVLSGGVVPSASSKRHFTSKSGVSDPIGGTANKDRGDGVPACGSNYSETPQRPNGVASLVGLAVFPDDEANATTVQNNYKSNDKNNITTNQRAHSGSSTNTTTTKNPAVVTERPISMDNANPSVNSNIKVVGPTAEVIQVVASLPLAEQPTDEAPAANKPSTITHETQTSTTTGATTTAQNGRSVPAVTTTNTRLISMLVCSTLLHGYYFSHLAMGVTLLPVPRKPPQLVELLKIHKNNTESCSSPNENNNITTNTISTKQDGKVICSPFAASPPSQSTILNEEYMRARAEHLNACVSAHPAAVVLAALKRPSDSTVQALARRLPVVSCPFYGPQRIRCLDVLYGRGKDSSEKEKEGESFPPTTASSSSKSPTNHNVLEAARMELAATEWRLHCERYRRSAKASSQIGRGNLNPNLKNGGTDDDDESCSTLAVALSIPPLPPPSLAPSPSDPDPFIPQILKRYLHPSFLPLYAFEVPSVPLVDFVDHLMTQFRCGAEGLVIALCLLAKLPPNHVPICDRSIHRMFLTALVLSCKLMTDQRIAMKVFSSVGGVTSADLMSMEWAFLTALDFDATVSTAMYVDMIFSLRQHCSTLSHASTQIKKANAANATAISATATDAAIKASSEAESLSSGAFGTKCEAVVKKEVCVKRPPERDDTIPKNEEQSLIAKEVVDSCSKESSSPLCIGRGKRDLMSLSRSGGGADNRPTAGRRSSSFASVGSISLQLVQTSSQSSNATSVVREAVTARGDGNIDSNILRKDAVEAPPVVHLMGVAGQTKTTPSKKSSYEMDSSAESTDTTVNGLTSGDESEVNGKKTEARTTPSSAIATMTDLAQSASATTTTAAPPIVSNKATAAGTNFSSKPAPTTIEDPYEWAPSAWKALIETLPVPATAVLRRELKAVIVEVIRKNNRMSNGDDSDTDLGLL